jgi:poly(hydroxyalkanoate) depolymerase family esterase
LGEFLDFSYNNYKYKLYVPDEYHSQQEFPLMVMLHGCGQNPDDFAAGTNMNTLAEKENFLVLYPDMNRHFKPSDMTGYNPFGCWNWFFDNNQHRGKGHPKLIYDIINEVKDTYNIDSNKVYAAGLSAGASLACILGVTYPDVFNGIGICSGLAYDAAKVFILTDPMAEVAKKRMEKGVPDPYACGNSAYEEMGEYQKKMRVIVFHGIHDTVVHPINAQQVITQWAQTNFLVDGGEELADVTPAVIKSDLLNGKSYTQHIHHDEEGEPLLELWMIDQMGHTWSGGNPEGSHTDPEGPNATEIIWNFFNPQQPQLEEEQIETHDVEAIPVEHQDHPPEQTLLETETESPSEPQDDSPSETETESPSEPQNNSPSETLIDAPNETLSDSPSESPKKNFFSTLFSKLGKRKEKNKSNN